MIPYFFKHAYSRVIAAFIGCIFGFVIGLVVALIMMLLGYEENNLTYGFAIVIICTLSGFGAGFEIIQKYLPRKLVELIFNILIPTNESLAAEFSDLYNWLHPFIVFFLIIISYYFSEKFNYYIQLLNPELNFPVVLSSIILFIILRVLYTIASGLMVTFISINSKLSKIADALESREDKR